MLNTEDEEVILRQNESREQEKILAKEKKQLPPKNLHYVIFYFCYNFYYARRVLRVLVSIPNSVEIALDSPLNEEEQRCSNFSFVAH